jgi:hypothetical protein
VVAFMSKLFRLSDCTSVKSMGDAMDIAVCWSTM